MDDALCALVTRLSRTVPTGGIVIARAAILASGAECNAVVAWILAHGGEPEAALSLAPRSGWHGSFGDRNQPEGRPPARFPMPAGALPSGVVCGAGWPAADSPGRRAQ